MPMPHGLRVIDTHVNIPWSQHDAARYGAFRGLQRDRESLDSFKMPAQYMFRGIPDLGDDTSTYVARVLEAMDRHDVAVALIPVGDAAAYPEIIRDHSDRFVFQAAVDPNKGMDEIRRIRALHAEYRLSGLSYFAAGSMPQVAINGKEMYPFYALACELELPFFLNVGVPGPRIPLATQKVELLDEICWFFPELTVVMRHGAEPWEDMAVKLMLKYPNLYYSTSAFAPRHYPKAIVDYANTRGAGKIIYAGYFAAGLSLDRIFSELKDVPFKDEVWPKFLRENAAKVLKIPL
nr:amidohydrolase family protein [uncultured Sphingomonas sp.]